MPAELVTDWKCVATSGHTIDGRFIKPEWLTEMAEIYDPKLYTAKIWIDHMRYASYGSVKALKAEGNGEEVKLFAKICPNRSLLTLNQIYEEHLHFSIEIRDDFRKTGKHYLSGLAMTDEPASVGTDEMRFSQKVGRDFSSRFPGEQVPDLRELENEDQDEKLYNRLVSFFSKTEKPKEDESMGNAKKFEELEQTVSELKSVVEGLAPLAEKFKEDPNGQQTKTEPETPADSEDFTELKGQIDELTGKYTDLVERLEKAVPGTHFGESTGPAGDRKEQL
ncbi:GPO family capsid scaffolding protein [Desulfosediminicola sp.]|uniref:GPO family capsid scaffolding protein n=1 Tax=Desulfosediminicola sp. TaxID=2886825 RepID=UPI003AF2D7F8